MGVSAARRLRRTVARPVSINESYPRPCGSRDHMPSLSSVRFRRASPADTPLLARMRHEFRSGQAPTAEPDDDFLRRCATWMAPRLESGSAWRAWLAEADGREAGSVWMQLVEKIPNPGQEGESLAYLSSFYVRPEHRNAGIGAGLLRTVLDECARLGVDTVFLWPSERSRSLYARNGFRHADQRVLLRRAQDQAHG